MVQLKEYLSLHFSGYRVTIYHRKTHIKPHTKIFHRWENWKAFKSLWFPDFIGLWKKTKRKYSWSWALNCIFLNKQNSEGGRKKKQFLSGLWITGQIRLQQKPAISVVPLSTLKFQHNDWTTSPKKRLAQMSSYMRAERYCTLHDTSSHASPQSEQGLNISCQ